MTRSEKRCGSDLHVDKERRQGPCHFRGSHPANRHATVAADSANAEATKCQSQASTPPAGTTPTAGAKHNLTSSRLPSSQERLRLSRRPSSHRQQVLRQRRLHPRRVL